MSDKSFLSWPFFDERHRELAREIGGWSADNLTGRYAGDLDTAIHIRTLVVKDGIAHIQAGGGTVADAKPDYEYEESVAKANAVLRAVALACEQADWA